MEDSSSIIWLYRNVTAARGIPSSALRGSPSERIWREEIGKIGRMLSGLKEQMSDLRRLGEACSRGVA